MHTSVQAVVAACDSDSAMLLTLVHYVFYMVWPETGEELLRVGGRLLPSELVRDREAV